MSQSGLCPAAEPQPGNRQRTDRRRKRESWYDIIKGPSASHQTTMRPFLKTCNRNVLIHSRRPVVRHLLPAIGVGSGQFLLKPKGEYGRAWYSQKNSNRAPHNDAAASESQQQKEKEKKKRKTGSQSSKNSLRKVAAQAGHAASGTGRTRVLHPPHFSPHSGKLLNGRTGLHSLLHCRKV